MILLLIIFILSVLLNVILLCLFAEQKNSYCDKSDSHDELSRSLYNSQRERTRTNAIFCKEQLADIIANKEKNARL